MSIGEHCDTEIKLLIISRNFREKSFFMALFIRAIQVQFLKLENVMHFTTRNNFPLLRAVDTTVYGYGEMQIKFIEYSETAMFQKHDVDIRNVVALIICRNLKISKARTFFVARPAVHFDRTLTRPKYRLKKYNKFKH